MTHRLFDLKWLALFVLLFSVNGVALPLIFIHGFKGSQLVDPAGDTKWVTPFEALGLSSPSLSLPTQWDGDQQNRDTLTAKRVLSDVMIVPKLVGEKVYGPWLKAAESFGVPFYPFAYDWRRDNLESLAAFETFVDRICNENKVTQVNIVAHSMGGLLTMALLLKHPEKIRKVFFAGTPFHGGIGFLPDLHVGTATGLNRKILAPEVLFTFPSVYSLFSDDKDAPLNFYDAKDWQKNELGVFSIPNRNRQADLEFLTKALERASKFRKLLRATIPKNQPEAMVILGWKFPTLDKMIHLGPHSVKGWDFQTAPKVPGDGRVGANNLPPDDFKFSLLYSEKEHANLLNDPIVIEKIKSAIMN